MKKDTTIINMLEGKRADDNSDEFATLGIESVIKQFFILIKTKQPEVENAFFIKNRNPMSNKIYSGYMAYVTGSEKIAAQLNSTEINYSHFNKWRSIPNTETYLEDFIPINWKAPFNFVSEKSALVIPVRSEKHYWGNLVCLADGDINWAEETKSVSKVFTTLVNDLLLYFFKQEREQFLMGNLKKQLDNKREIIDSLQKAIDDKNKVIKKLKVEEQCAEFVWESETEKYDEVWVTVHGFKSGSPEPTVSKWERISDQANLSKINDLFFRKKLNRKAI